MVESRQNRRMIRALVPLGIVVIAAILSAPASRRTPPAHLAGTGLYSLLATKTPSASNLFFSPQYPLWTDGAEKKRWISLPPGKAIDASNPDDWVFPVGTKFWKEFAFSGKRVETRYIEKVGAKEWMYATYAWDDDQTDAVLVDKAGLPDHAEIAPGIRHSLPGVEDCKSCHEGQGRDVVLGFSALQLSRDRDPNAPHADRATPDMMNLDSLVARKLIVHLPASLIDTPPTIHARSPIERAVLGYLSGNCGGCHNATDPLSSVGMFLKRSAVCDTATLRKEMLTVVGHFSKYQIPNFGPYDTYRVRPGDPARSAIVNRMDTRDPYRQMPPLGSKIVDREAIILITKWIRNDLKSHNEE
jgi:hypothetical protein